MRVERAEPVFFGRQDSFHFLKSFKSLNFSANPANFEKLCSSRNLWLRNFALYRLSHLLFQPYQYCSYKYRKITAAYLENWKKLFTYNLNVLIFWLSIVLQPFRDFYWLPARNFFNARDYIFGGYQGKHYRCNGKNLRFYYSCSIQLLFSMNWSNWVHPTVILLFTVFRVYNIIWIVHLLFLLQKLATEKWTIAYFCLFCIFCLFTCELSGTALAKLENFASCSLEPFSFNTVNWISHI